MSIFGSEKLLEHGQWKQHFRLTMILTTRVNLHT